MRLIFSAMDGTFLADDKTIPEGNLRALDLIAQAGDRFVPCTGRLFDGIPACVLERPDVEYAISANGACVSSKTAQGWQLVHAHEMAPETMLAVAHAVESMDLLVEFFTEHAIFITNDRFAAFDRYFKDTPFYEYAQRTRRPYPGTVEELVAACAPIFRMNLRTYTPQVSREAIRALAGIGGLHVTSSIPRAVDITVAGATKGTAAAWLAERLGVSLADAIAFGDANNDSTLLAAVGDGVAVSNADEDAVRAARHRTCSNNEAGVGRYIARHYEKED